jgi:hypothetical protein
MAPPLPNDRNSQRPGIAIPGHTPVETRNQTLETSEDLTGLPLLSTWPRLYVFVLIAFVLTVLALLWLTRSFS